MPSEIQVDSSSIQLILIVLIVVAIGLYLFYELRKTNQSLSIAMRDIMDIKKFIDFDKENSIREGKIALGISREQNMELFQKIDQEMEMNANQKQMEFNQGMNQGINQEMNSNQKQMEFNQEINGSANDLVNQEIKEVNETPSIFPSAQYESEVSIEQDKIVHSESEDSSDSESDSESGSEINNKIFVDPDKLEILMSEGGNKETEENNPNLN